MHNHRPGRPGGWQQANQPDATDAAEWFAGRLPDGWFTGDPEVIVDREEITVIGHLPVVEGETGARASGRASRFREDREDTRGERMCIADEVQDKYGRKVSWGAEIGGEGDDTRQRVLFTHVAVPVMTRLRQAERQVLDTLVVRLVCEHTDDWLVRLREAMAHVDDLRAEGPGL